MQEDQELLAGSAGVNSDPPPWQSQIDALATNDTDEQDPRDQLDELRQRIRSGDLSRSECDQLDQLVFVVALAERRTATAARDFPGEVVVQLALAAEAWSRVGAQLQVMLRQGAGRLNGDVPPHALGRAWS